MSSGSSSSWNKVRSPRQLCVALWFKRGDLGDPGRGGAYRIPVLQLLHSWARVCPVQPQADFALGVSVQTLVHCTSHLSRDAGTRA